MLRSSPQLKKMLADWQQLPPLTQELLLLIAINTVLVFPSILLTLSDRFIFELPVKLREIPQYHLWQFLRLRQDLDSWEPMWQAFEQIKAAPKEPLYAQIFFDEHTKFQYPLTSLLLFYGLQVVLVPFNPQYPETLYQLLAIISWLSFIGLLIVSVIIFRDSQRVSVSTAQTLATDANKPKPLLSILLLLGLGLTFYPAIRAYSLGQIQAWINLIFALMLWAWIHEKKKISGVLGGLICLIKPQYAVILLWGLLRKQWQFAIALLSVTAIGWLTACTLFGLSNNLDYLKVLSFISKRGEAYYPNESVNGLMNRLLFNGSNLQWTGDAFAPFNGWVYACTLLSSVFLLIVALRSPRPKATSDSSTDFMLVSLTATMASPVAWEHHYGILLPIYAVLLPQLSQHRIWGSFTLPLLGLSYWLTSNYFYVAKKFAALPLLNIFQSYLFFGALIVLLSLHRLRAQNYTIHTRFNRCRHEMTMMPSTPKLVDLPMNSPVVAAFDFDGTLTRRDSFLPFLSAIAGRRRFILGMVYLSPVLIGYALKRISNWQAKEAVLTYFLAGMSVSQLERLSQQFAEQTLPQLLRPEAVDRLRWHQQQGHTTLLVSASLEIYLRPLAACMNIDQVIGTRLESHHDRLSGRILGKNCYGPEKVIRLQPWVDHTQSVLYAYGDSRGDRDLLAIAQFPYYRKFKD